MKKKIIISILILTSLFIISGCVNNNENISNNIENSAQGKKTVQKVNVGDLTIELDYTGSFNEITYLFPSKAITSSLGTYNIMDYMNGEEFIFRVAMYFFENKTIEQVMMDSDTNSIGTKTINGKQWHVFEGKVSDGNNLYNYVCEYNNNTYTITFIYDKSITDFIDVFMNTIQFK